MSMVSPLKLFDGEAHSVKIAQNLELGEEFRILFNNTDNYHLWKQCVQRQTITPELKFTESIYLRYLKDLPPDVTTEKANQHMEIADTYLVEMPLFKKAIKWFEDALLSAGANQVEFGRIIISKLSKGAVIGLHIDQGKYFDYYDRFHFTVTAAADNLFVIQYKKYILDQDSLYWVDNHVPHWLKNNSDEDRINFIIDARLT